MDKEGAGSGQRSTGVGNGDSNRPTWTRVDTMFHKLWGIMTTKRLSMRNLFAIVLLVGATFAHAAGTVVEVYKSATCGCCTEWINHLRANGFDVKAHDVEDPAAHRAKHGVPDALGSCHTAVVNGYAIEGHVPASEIKRLLAERPNARGLAVPGMPLGSPGMEGPRADPYAVLLIGKDGKTYSTYATYPK